MCDHNLKRSVSMPDFGTLHFLHTHVQLGSIKYASYNKSAENFNKPTNKLLIAHYCEQQSACYNYYFYDPLSGTTQVSQYQKDKSFWILLKHR